MDRARPTSARLEYACHRISTRSSSARRQRVSARWWTPNRRILTVSTDTQSFFFLLLIHFIVQMTTTASLFTYWRQRHLEQHRSRQPTLRWPNIGTFPCVMYMMRLRNERKSGFSMSMSTMQRRNKDLDEYSSGCCKHQCKLFPAANRLPDVSFLKLHHNS